MGVLSAAKVGVNVSYSRGMDIVGEIHYDWPLESTLEVRRKRILCSSGAVLVSAGSTGSSAQHPTYVGQRLLGYTHAPLQSVVCQETCWLGRL